MQGSDESGDYTSLPVPTRVDAFLFETGDIDSARLIVTHIKTKCKHLKPWPLIIKKGAKKQTTYEISVMNHRGCRPSEEEHAEYHDAVGDVLEELTTPIHGNLG